MTDFQSGMMAPDFSLAGFKLSEALKKGAVLLTFYKKTCPTCQLAYPFFERLHRHYSGLNFQIIGIGQDPETREFSKTYDITFRMISDTPSYAISKQFHLTNVPTAFLVTPHVGTPDKRIDAVVVGFSKTEFLDLSKRISEKTNRASFDLFKNTTVPEFKPG